MTGALVQPPALCPFCPWNHLWTWLAFGAGVAMWRRDDVPTLPPPEHRRGLYGWAAVCIAWCLSWQFAWALATWAGWLGDGGPPALF